MRTIIIFLVLAVLVLLLGNSAVAKSDTINFEINVDNALVRDMENAISFVSSQHPEIGNFSVEEREIPEGAYAGTTKYGNIVLNKDFAEHPDSWAAAFKWDQVNYFHGRACSSAGSYVGFHEMAHLISRAHGSDAPGHAEIIYGTGRGLPLSGYSFHEDGTVFWEEAIADAFAEVMCGHPSDLEQQLTYILETS